MNFLDPLPVIRVTFIPGMANLVTGVLTVISCRCLPGLRLDSSLIKCKGD